MKKLLIAAGSTCLLLAVITNKSIAQTDNLALSNQSGLKEISVNAMSNADENSSHKLSSAIVNSKALRTLEESFKNVNDLEWYSLNGGYYLAEFNINGRNTRAVLRKHGAILYSIGDGSEKDLPAEVRKQIKSNYVDYIIGKVLEINSDSRTAWVVNLHDDNNLIIARVIDGELDELGHYKTQPGTQKNK